MDLKLYLRAQRDRVGAIVCVSLGALALLIGWIGVSGNALVYKQLAYIVSGGLFGIALVGIGTTLWLSADLADEWRKLDRVEDALRGRLADSPPVDDGYEPADAFDPAPATTVRNARVARPAAADDIVEQRPSSEALEAPRSRRRTSRT